MQGRIPAGRLVPPGPALRKPITSGCAASEPASVRKSEYRCQTQQSFWMPFTVPNVYQPCQILPLLDTPMYSSFRTSAVPNAEPTLAPSVNLTSSLLCLPAQLVGQ